MKLVELLFYSTKLYTESQFGLLCLAHYFDSCWSTDINSFFYSTRRIFFFSCLRHLVFVLVNFAEQPSSNLHLNSILKSVKPNFKSKNIDYSFCFNFYLRHFNIFQKTSSNYLILLFLKYITLLVVFLCCNVR